MLDAFLFVGLPYIAIVVCVVGSVWRYRSHRYSYSALSSQFLENRKLLWGSVPWHAGLFVVLILHLLPVIVPGLWARLMAVPSLLIAIEALGMCAALLALAGLGVLILRRLMNPYVQAVTTRMDLVILALFAVQVILGIVTAATVRWGAQWVTGTTTPYLWSLLLLRPDLSYVADMPVVVKAHLVGAWLVVLLIPFSRLVHVFSLPLKYLLHRPQFVLWSSPRRMEAPVAEAPALESRRLFLRGVTGMAAGGALMSVGVLEKVVGFYRGPRLTPEEQAAQLEHNLKRLQMTAEEKALELERLRQDYILVAALSELDEKRGKYFIDYEMRPALAFRNPDGLPLLISAKCTHLGCTVQADMNDKGQILCPCHVSWFDVKTGAPHEGSPAKAPLPILGWVVMDADNNIVASKRPGEPPTGTIDPELARTCRVYIAKEHTEA